MHRASIRRSSIAAAVLSGALIITGCSGDSDKDEEQDNTTASPAQTAESAETAETTETAESAESAEAGESADQASTEATDDATEDSDSAASEEQTEVQIGETADDPGTGDSIEVVSAVRDFPSEENADEIESGGEVVLVEVTVTPGSDYSGLISVGSFQISWDDGNEFSPNDTSWMGDELEAAGFTPFESFGRTQGEQTGWIAFVADERADTYVLSYTREEAEVLASDEVVEEFSTEFEIPMD